MTLDSKKCKHAQTRQLNTESGLTLQLKKPARILNNETCRVYFMITARIFLYGGDIVRRGNRNLGVVGKLAQMLTLAPPWSPIIGQVDAAA